MCASCPATMLDADPAVLYEVETRRPDEQVRRNSERFPEAFMFQLSQAERNAFGWQFAISKIGRVQHRKCLPYACAEHGAIMILIRTWPA